MYVSLTKASSLFASVAGGAVTVGSVAAVELVPSVVLLLLLARDVVGRRDFMDRCVNMLLVDAKSGDCKGVCCKF
jgi:hypothetical protein